MASTDTNDNGSGVPRKKRYQTVRTAIRRMLERSTRLAIGRMGDTTDGANRQGVGTSVIQIETRPKAGSTTPNRKFVRVDVKMTVSDHDGPCPEPVAPPLPIPVKAVKQWYWWLAVPILGYFLWNGPDSHGPLPPLPSQNRPPVVAPVTSDPGASSHPAKPIPTTTTTTLTPDHPVPVQNGGAPVADSGASQAPASGASNLGCMGSTGQLANAPDYTHPYLSGWVTAHATTWFVRRLSVCQSEVLAYDLRNHVINVQEYGNDREFLGQRVYVYSKDQIQIDAYDARDQFAGRTIYVYAGGPVQRVSLAFRFDAFERKTLTAQINRNDDGSMVSITVWEYCSDGSLAQKYTLDNPQQIASFLADHFHQFPEFSSGNW
ncbi:MAG TPA: hypothetical protein V6C97_18885 [Oculatellaceae cyanobacterium]